MSATRSLWGCAVIMLVVAGHAGSIPRELVLTSTNGSFRVRSDVRARFETSAVSRGSRSLLDRPTVSRGAETVLVARGDVTEELRVVPEGIEQSWRFARKPVGSGDVTVRVRAEELDLRGVDDRGITLSDRESGTIILYGMGTWVDARGERFPIASRIDGDAIALTIPESVIEKAAYPAVLDPTISTEMAMGPTLAGPPQDLQRNVASGTDGSGYLVTWQDFRALDPILYGARVDAAGKVLDPVGFPISRGPITHPTTPLSASLAFGGTSYLVAYRSAATGVRAVRVTPAGAVLDSDDIVVTTTTGTTRVDAAFNGTQYFVTSQGPLGILGVRVSTAGIVLDATPLVLANAPYGNPLNIPYGTACSAAMCLVAWQETATKTVWAVRVNAAGTLLDAPPLTIATDVSAIASTEGSKVTFDGTRFVVGYGGVVGASNLVHLAFVDTAGVIEIVPTQVPAAPDAILFDGAQYDVVQGAITRVAADGTQVGTRLNLAGSATGVACRATDCISAGQQSTSQGTAVIARRLTSANAWIDPAPFRLNTLADTQRFGGAASRGSEALAVWVRPARTRVLDEARWVTQTHERERGALSPSTAAVPREAAARSRVRRAA